MSESECREYVVNRYRDPRQNFGTMFAKITKRAGLSPILRPFDNMRASRSNEVYSRFGAHKESEWIGHSARVRKDHYGMITDDDFEQAAQWRIPPAVPPLNGQNKYQMNTVTRNKKTASVELAVICDDL